MTTRPGVLHGPPPAPPNTVSGQLASSRYAPQAASAAFGKVLRQAVAAVCVGNGFDSADPEVLELLTHAASAYMKEISEGARVITENSGRTKMVPADIWLALVNMGQNVMQLPDFLNQQSGRCIVIAPPKIGNPPAVPNPLRVGHARNHHPHIHDHFPPFPDPHTYVRSEISLEPDQSYERARELLAQKKRESEISLTDFFLRTHHSSCVFREAEARIRSDARQMVANRKQRDDARKAQKKALKRKVGGEPIDDKMMGGDLPESLLEQEEERRQDASASGQKMEEEDEEELVLEILDTENSIVRRKIPSHCFILDPTHEHRPYISALMGDMQEDDGDTVEAKPKKSVTAAGVVNRERESVGGGGGGGEARVERNGAAEERPLDNVYLRPPKITNA